MIAGQVTCRLRFWLAVPAPVLLVFSVCAYGDAPALPEPGVPKMVAVPLALSV